MKRRHAKAVRQVAAILDHRLRPLTDSLDKQHHVEVTEGKEPVIRITIKDKA